MNNNGQKENQSLTPNDPMQHPDSLDVSQRRPRRLEHPLPAVRQERRLEQLGRVADLR